MPRLAVASVPPASGMIGDSPIGRANFNAEKLTAAKMTRKVALAKPEIAASGAAKAKARDRPVSASNAT